MGLIDAYRAFRESRRDSDHESDGLVSLNLKTVSSLPQHHGANSWLDMRGGYQYPNTRINFSADVGDLRTSTLVMAAIQWAATNLADARLRVIKYGTDRKETEIESHALSQMWERPNPYYSGDTLLCGLALSWITASRAYLIKSKAKFGNPLWLWWEPHWTIEPRWTDGDEKLIS
jgi:hypothetical protein